ncbi:MAG TPA: hypothetical protein VFI22_15630, partial [Thermomicrobiales bacterium]|nr:hypothetical protein [Thermomicrobiales bacterium]
MPPLRSGGSYGASPVPPPPPPADGAYYPDDYDPTQLTPEQQAAVAAATAPAPAPAPPPPSPDYVNSLNQVSQYNQGNVYSTGTPEAQPVWTPPPSPPVQANDLYGQPAPVPTYDPSQDNNQYGMGFYSTPQGFDPS